jgi:hypothetical protein
MWVSDVLPGNVHDLAAARQNVLAVLRPFLDAMPALTAFFHYDATRRLAEADQATVRAAAIDALTPWLPGLASRVTDSHVTRWPQALPYVPVGHATAVKRYRGILPENCRVVLTGDYLGFPWSDSALSTASGPPASSSPPAPGIAKQCQVRSYLVGRWTPTPER